jgi:hypothetical protein
MLSLLPFKTYALNLWILSRTGLGLLGKLDAIKCPTKIVFRG